MRFNSFLDFGFSGTGYYTKNQERNIKALVHALEALRDIMITNEKYADDVRVLARIHSVLVGKHQDIVEFFFYALYVVGELNTGTRSIMTPEEYKDIKNNYFNGGNKATGDVDIVLQGLFKHLDRVIQNHFINELYDEINRLIDFTLSGLPLTIPSKKIEEYNPPLDDFVETFLYKGTRPVVNQIRGHLGVTKKMMDDYFNEYFDLA